jgi:TRAP-type mannitol/chloroaromatic compound transport system permease large subunit
MTQFLINNMAPLMFASLIVVMLFGYPVARHCRSASGR